jgi:hypothetical protein
MTISKQAETRNYIHPPQPEPGDDPRLMLFVPLADLKIDQTKQRDVADARPEELGEFSWRLFETPTVVARDDGSLVVAEGQRRVTLAHMSIGNGTLEKDVRGWVVVLTGESDEAGLALAITKSRKAHSPYQQWNMQVGRGNPLEVAATQVLEDLGLHMAPTSHVAGGIAAVGTVRLIMQSFDSRRKNLAGPELREGAELLSTTLSVLREAFPAGQRMQYDGMLIKATGSLLFRNAESIDPARLATILSHMEARRWVEQKANKRPSQTNVEAIALVICDEYNRGKREDSPARIKW